MAEIDIYGDESDVCGRFCVSGQSSGRLILLSRANTKIYGDLDESKPSVASSSSAQNQSASTAASSMDSKPETKAKVSSIAGKTHYRRWLRTCVSRMRQSDGERCWFLVGSLTNARTARQRQQHDAEHDEQPYDAKHECHDAGHAGWYVAQCHGQLRKYDGDGWTRNEYGQHG